MPISSAQVLVLVQRFQALADEVEAKRAVVPFMSDEWHSLGQQRRALTRASGQLQDTALSAALDELEPHYDAMLSVVRDLKDEIGREEKIERVLSIVASGLAISAAVLEGNPAAVFKALDKARLLLTESA